MDIQEYIASGILEAYALNDLSQEEKQQVEEMLSQHAELRDELNLIEEGLEALAMETAIAPPAQLKENLFAALDLQIAELEKEEVDPAAESVLDGENEEIPTEPEPIHRPTPKVVEITPKRSGAKVWTYVAAASVSVALVSSFMAYDFYNRWQQSRTAFEDMARANEVLAQQNQQIHRLIDDIEGSYNVLVNPDFGRVPMNSVIEGQSYAASVYWNKKTEEAYLSISQLKRLSAAQQYQLWAIIDGKPVDMGVFDGTETTLTKMKSIAGAVTFAVTIEPKGGSENPTLDQMQVAGNVS